MSNTSKISKINMSNSNKEMFPEYCPVYLKKQNKIIDEDGNIWKKITVTGYLRECDNFFWPYDPRNINNNYHQFPPSVSSVAETRN